MTESNPTAYREAGHAIAAWLLTDCPFDTVTIVPGEPSIGALVRQRLLDDDDIDLALEYGHQDEIRRNRNRIGDAILVSLAGPYAQRRHAPSSKWRRGKDIKEASRLIYALYQHCHRPIRAISSFQRHTNVIMDDFLEGHWNAIETLAHRLIRDSLLGGDGAVTPSFLIFHAVNADQRQSHPIRIDQRQHRLIKAPLYCAVLNPLRVASVPRRPASSTARA
jgi:hypothetical protein